MNTMPTDLNLVRILYLRLVAKQGSRIAAYLFLLLVTAGLQLPIPFLLSDLIDNLSHGVHSTTLSMNIASIVGLSSLSLLLSTLGKVYSAKLNWQFLLDIRLTIFESLQYAPLRFIRTFDTSDLQTRFTGDVGVLNYFLPTGLAEAIRHVCFVLVFGGVLIYTSPVIVLYIAGFLPLAVVIFKVGSQRLSLLANEARAGYAEANTTIQESLMSLRESQITGTRSFHLSRLRFSLEKSEAKLFWMRRYSALMVGVLGIIPIMATAMIWIVGGAKVDTHELSIGQLVSFLLILSMLYAPISGLFNAASGYVYELAAFRRIASLLHVSPETAQDHASVSELPASDRPTPVALELRDVTFTYRARPIIKGLSATIPAGRCTAFMGANGTGKSTLALLLAGLDQPSSGIVYLDDFPLPSLSTNVLASQYGYVPQDVFLFGDSLRMNITMGRKIADDHIHNTLTEIGWGDFMSEWSQGLDMMIPENGRNLSGGQRQKIALLRALVNRPSILILDEPEKNLDKHSLEDLASYLARLKGRCTIVLITHGEAFRSIIDVTLDMSLPHRHDVASLGISPCGELDDGSA